MKIGVLSDTHNILPTIDRALDTFAQQNVRLIVHSGDWTSLSTLLHVRHEADRLGLPLRGVLGNNDQALIPYLSDRHATPEFEITEGTLRFSHGSLAFAIYHGHHEPTRRALLADPAIDVLFFGHTHRPSIETVGTKQIINPGSTAFSIPRQKSFRPSAALYNTVSRQAEIIYLT